MPLLEIRQDSDCEICESENDSDGEDFEESSLHDDGMKRSDYTLLTAWVTGDKATLEEEDIQMEMFDITRSWMSASLFKVFKMPGVDDPRLCSLEMLPAIQFSEWFSFDSAFPTALCLIFANAMLIFG